jgi:hypothetical protein
MVSGDHSRHPVAHPIDDSGAFVTKDHRVEVRTEVRAPGDQVGVAQTSADDTDQHLTGPRIFDYYFLDHVRFFGAAQHCRSRTNHR